MHTHAHTHASGRKTRLLSDLKNSMGLPKTAQKTPAPKSHSQNQTKENAFFGHVHQKGERAFVVREHTARNSAGVQTFRSTERSCLWERSRHFPSQLPLSNAQEGARDRETAPFERTVTCGLMRGIFMFPPVKREEGLFSGPQSPPPSKFLRL